MKKLIFKYWLLNIFTSLALYLGFRIMLINTEEHERNTFEFILYILKLILDLYIIGLFLTVMMVFSTTYFLNLNDKIRNNTFFSFLTFLGIPIGIVLFYAIQFSRDFPTEGFKGLLLLENYFVVALLYIFFSSILFILFRRNMAKM